MTTRGDSGQYAHQMSRVGWAIGAAAVVMIPAVALAELPPPETWGDELHFGEWTVRPSAELRIRGEYRRRPIDVGGNLYERTAIQSDGFEAATPTTAAIAPPVFDEWVLSERVRFGLAARYGKAGAVVTLQDARTLGWLPGTAPAVQRPGSGTLEPYEAYLELRDDEIKPMVEARIGRQPVMWGDGRLLATHDWWQRGAALDAVRLRFHFGDGLTDLEALAVMLAMPGPVPPPDAHNGAALEGTGAQLFGLQSAWHLFPLLELELSGLARVAREPLPPELTRGDTYTIDLRAFGDYRGLSYSAEGAYQFGLVAGYGNNRTISALAAAARVDWQTALPLDFRFGLAAAYASGDGSNGRGERLGRFDPILADVHRHHGAMDLYAWSNVFDAGASVGLRLADGFDGSLRYGFVGLAQPGDRWSTAGLVAVGADPNNTSRTLGHELDARIAYEPWQGVVFDGGYGVFVTGEGARNILAVAGRGQPSLMHFAYLQAGLRTR